MSNDLTYEFDNRSILSALKQVNKAFEDTQKTGVKSGDAWNTAFTNLSDQLVKVTDRATQAQNRYVKSILAANDAYGKSPIDREIAKRDRIIKQLGDNEKAVRQVTASYDALIKKMKEEESHVGGSGHGPLSGAGRFAFLGVKDLFEGRTANSIAEGANVLTKLGGTALVVGGVAAALGAVAVAAQHSRKYLAEYAVEVRDVELKTGLSARQFTDFSFAAQAVGKDITIVDRLMRGLSQATEELGPSGDKARKTLADIGVAVTDINGNVRPTADLLLSISDGMAKLAPGTKLSAEAIELFKRAGVDAIPFLKELRENTDYARAHGLPAPGEEDLTRWANYNKQIALFDSYWSAIKRAAADTIAVKVEFITSVGGAAVGLFNKFFGEGGVRSSAEDKLHVVGPRGGGEGVRYLTDEQYQREQAEDRTRAEMDAHGGLMAYTAAAGRVSPFLSALSSSTHERADRTLSRLKSALDEQVNKLERLGQSGVIRPDIERDQEKAVLAANSAYQTQLSIVKRLSEEESDRLSNAEALRKIIETTTQSVAEGPYVSKTDRTLLEFSRRRGVTPSQVSAAELGLRPEAQRDADLAYTRARAAGREGIDRAIEAIGTPGGGIIPKSAEQLSEQLRESRNKNERDFLSTLEREKRVITENLSIYSAGLKEINKGQLDASESALRLASTIAPDTLANRQQYERQLASIKIAALNDVMREEKEDAKLKYAYEGDQIAAIRDAELKNAREVAGVRADLAQQNAKAYREQLDSIKKETSSLLETLFTTPSKFASQLGSTLRSAILRPITDALSERIAGGLQPLIFGSNGTSGIAGGLRSLAGGGSGIGAPLMPAASALTYAAGALTSAASTLSMGGGGGGFSLPSGGVVGGVGGGGFGGFGGGGQDSISGSNGGFTGAGIPGIGGDGVGGFNLGGLFGRGGGSGSGGGGFSLGNLRNLGGILRQSGSGILSNLTETGRSLRSAFGFGGPHQGGSLFSNLSRGPASGTPVGGLVAGAGIGLAMHGLLGEARGTWSGVAQGAAGGFLVAGPIGAAIGAAIGIGEMLAGVESPRREAKRLVKGLYHIDINNNAADQIVAIAKDRYASHVSIAVRSPEVRQMLGLFAAGTGQAGAFPQSASSPHGGGLVESGGSLMQAAQYQYGNPYSYSSSLPVFGGGPTGSYPSPGGGGGPVLLSVNVQGAGIAPFFSGQVVTPDFVASRQASALASSSNRVGMSLALAQPGSIVG